MPNQYTYIRHNHKGRGKVDLSYLNPKIIPKFIIEELCKEEKTSERM